MGITDFLGDIGDGIKHGLDKTVEGLNVVDRHINPFHVEQTITPEGEQAAMDAVMQGKRQPQGLLAPGIEDVLYVYTWTRDNVVSQPLSTLALQLKRSRESSSDLFGFGGDLWSSAAWNESWRAANHISPGQALLMTPEEATQAIESPLLYYKPPEAYLPPWFKDLSQGEQQDLLREAGMPAIGNQFVEKAKGNSAWLRYGSAALDFASLVFLDPATLAFGGAARLRRISGSPEQMAQGAIGLRGLKEIRRPKGGWTEGDIDAIMASTQMAQLKAGIWENRTNSQLLNNTELARRSGMGPKFGIIASKLADEQELDLFVRTGMGDMRAMRELGTRNAAIGLRLDAGVARIDHLDLMRSRYADFPDARIGAIIDNELTRLQRQIDADTVMGERYASILGVRNQLDKLYVDRWAIQRATDRTIAQNKYTPGRTTGIPRTLARGTGRDITIRPGVGAIQFGRKGFGIGGEISRYRPTPIESGYVHTRLWGVSDFFAMPVNFVRSVRNMHPNGFMSIHSVDKDSLVELRGFLARIPNMKPSTREEIINNYSRTTTEGQRRTILEDVGRVASESIAKKYGLDAEVGQELYRTYLKRKGMEMAHVERYSAGRRSPEEVTAMRQQAGLREDVPYETDQLARLDTFVTQDGSAIALEPFTVTRLVNNHVLQDLDLLDKVMRRNSGKLQAAHRATGKARDAVESMADSFNQLWKFTTLFRLGYLPRVVGDELAGQWAAAGTAAMAMRTIRGVRNAFDNIGLWGARSALEARRNTALAGAQFADDEMRLLSPQIRRLERDVLGREASDLAEMQHAFRRHQKAQAKAAQLDPADLSPKAHAVRTLASQREQQLRQVEARIGAGASPGKKAALDRLKDKRDFMARFKDLQTRAAADYEQQTQKVIQGNQAVTIDGKIFPALFEGREGQYYKDLFTADQTVGNLLNTNKQLLQGAIQRSFDHGAEPISAVQDATAHLSAWAHVINNQIMQDAMQALFVRGATAEEVLDWIRKTAAGRSYRARLPQMVDVEDFVQSAKYEVDQYLHTPELRMKALEPDGVTPSWLEGAFPNIADRPDVHTGRTLQGMRETEAVIGRIREFFFKRVVAQLSDRSSRHPLMNQFYEGHLKTLTAQRKAQGYRMDKMTVEEVEELASSARSLALKDARELVFDIAHRSDAAAALRFISPFFSATAESFQRWGRIIADKPQVAGYAGAWYNGPAYGGALQDQDGNRIDRYGNAYILEYPLNPETGEVDYTAKPTVTKRQVPKSERFIVTRMPEWVADSSLGKALGVARAGSELRISQNSMNMVTQGDPWFNPGVGPIVQIPVNEWVRDKPSQAELARHLGILPFGVTTEPAFGDNPLGRAITIASPTVIRNAISAFDTSDARYQRIKLQITQREIFEFTESHDRPPTQAEIGKMQKRIADKTRNYWLFTAGSSFLQPFATQRSDPYQFFRDQYLTLRRQNPLTADDQYLQRYGESHFIFAQEISDSAGVPPTKRATELMKAYAGEIAENPELAALIVGPEGIGPFSREAYAYQLNNPLVPGGGEMIRTRMTADEAMEENQRRLGWAKYTSRMNELRAKLYQAGFQSFDDEGAEDFADERKAWTSLYSEPLYPDGSVNPYYNDAWSRDFLTFDARKYDRMIPALTRVARSDLAKLPNRSDLRVLQQYLGGRQGLLEELNARKAAGEPGTLAAEANADLRYQWALFVDGLIESDTRFGDLHARYLARDMQVDVEEELEEE